MNENSTYYFLIRQIGTELMLTRAISNLENPEPDEWKEPESCFSPSEGSIQAILGFARSLEVAETESVGPVEWILN